MDWTPGHPRRAVGAPGSALIRRLGEGPEILGGGPLAALDTLARSGLPVLEGVVLTLKAHEEFLRGSGLLAAIRAGDAAGAPSRRALLLRNAYASAPVGEALHGLIIEAIIGLEARSVSVLSEDGAWQGLNNIPDVRDAVREAWLSAAGIERQVRAAATSGSLPTWPVLIQREAQPEHVGWTRVGGQRPGALHDVRPARGTSPPARTIAELALEAGVALDGPARLHLGLERGTWYVLEVEHE